MDYSSGSHKVNWEPPKPHRVCWLCLVLAAPLVLFHWMLPFVTDTTLGNDYASFPIQHQIELMASIRQGAFPLFVPGFAGGQSSAALTLGQVYHPIAQLAAHLPGYWNGHALELITLLRLLSLAAAHLILFALLHKLGLSRPLAFCLSLGAVYNMRCLDLFRYGAALEAWTGHLLLSSALGLLCTAPRKPSLWLLVCASTYWTVVSGHPQMMYYAFGGAIVLGLILPFYCSVMVPAHLHIRRYTLTAISAVSAGVLLSSAYILPFYFDFIVSNGGRVGREYAWADMFRDTFAGTIANLYNVFGADVHGAFGGTALLAVGYALPLVVLAKVRVPGAVWSLWAMAVLVFLHMQGARTPIHEAAWRWLPLASSFRVAGRMSLVLPLQLVLILAWMVKPSTGTVVSSAKQRNALLLAVGVVVCGAGAYLIATASGELPATDLCPAEIYDLPKWLVYAFQATGILSLGILGYSCAIRRSGTRALAWSLMALVLTQTWMTIHFGTWKRDKVATPPLAGILAAKKKRLDYPFVPGAGLCRRDVWRQAREAFLEPHLAKIHTGVIPVSDRIHAYDVMKRCLTQRHVVVESDNVRLIRPHSDQGLVQLAFSSFNRLVIDCFAPDSAVVQVAYPLSSHWTASVNGDRTSPLRTNGIYVGIQVPPGRSRVDLRYNSPAAVWGATISCLVAVAICFGFACVVRKAGMGRFHLFVALLALLPLATWVSWYSNLYTGGDFGTLYRWLTPPAGTPVNLAYARPTNTTSIYMPNFVYLYGPQCAVDGFGTASHTTATKALPEQSWSVDLLRTCRIDSIIVTMPPASEEELDCRQLVVTASENGDEWHSVGGLRVLDDSRTRVPFRLSPPLLARYINVGSVDSCRVVLDEVEVFGCVFHAHSLCETNTSAGHCSSVAEAAAER